MATIRRGTTANGHLTWGSPETIKPVSFTPIPPPPMAAKATIVSFQTPIYTDQTSRAVMKVTTQQIPFQVRWQWRKMTSTGWETAAVNFPTDKDHSYNRKNLPWTNILPGPGRYPIRIQCLDKDGHVTDESSGTSRVIEVLPAPEPPHPIPPEPPTPLPPIPTIRRGLVRGNGFQVVDDAGGYLALGTSMFWAAGGWLRERQRCQDNLRWCANQGFDFVRVIATGLRMGTNERSVSPKDPAFVPTLAELTDFAWSIGLRIQWTIFGAVYDAPSVADRQACIDQVVLALRDRPWAVQMIEVANEGWQNGFPGDAGATELKHLADRLAGQLPTLVATTCPHSGDDITPAQVQLYYKNCRASIQTNHFARSTNPPDGVWRPTRKPWREQHFAVDGCCLLVQNNEPRGPDSSVTQTHDPLVLAMDAATTWLCGVGSYVLHTGAGIYGLPDPAHGRPANMWETTGIDNICSGLRVVRQLLPVDLPNFTKYQSNASGAPFGFVDVPEEQFTLAYSAESGGRLVQPVGGVVKATTFTLRHGTCNGKVYHPVTGQVLETFDRAYHVDPGRPGVIAIATRTS